MSQEGEQDLDCGLILKQVLLKIGGSGIDDEAGWANFRDPRVLDYLLKHGREFPTQQMECLRQTPFPDWRKELNPVQCHDNCVDLRCYAGSGRSEYRIVHGWALSANGIWYCHSWCIQRTGPENIIETTIPRIAYFGFVVPDDVDPRAILFVLSTLGDLLQYRQNLAP